MALSDEEVHELFLEIGKGGRSSLITGERGMGKTALAVWLCEWLRTHGEGCEICREYGIEPKGWWILSNVIIIRKGGKEDYPKSWLKVRSFAELMFQVGKILAKDPRANIMWLIDEGAASFSIYESVFTKRNRTLIVFLTLARKFRLANITITLSPKLVHKQLRSVSGGFLAAILRKEGRVIRERARHLLGKYDERSIVILEFPELSETDFEILTINTGDKEMPTISQPDHQVEDGELVFDTLAAASFDIGNMIGASHKPFQFGKFLAWISDCQSAVVPSRILEFFQKEGEVEVEVPLDLLEAESVVKGTPQWGREVVLPVVIRELPALLDEGLSSNRGLADRLMPILIAEGIEISDERLRKSYVPMAKKRLKADNADLIEQIG